MACRWRREVANFKRGRAKNRRAGCLMCKPWKMNGARPERKKLGERRLERLKDLLIEALARGVL